MQNCYIINDSELNSFIIDPGDNAVEIVEYIEKNRLKLKAIINTHGHYDHVGAVSELKRYFKIPFYLSKKDIIILKYANLFRNLFDRKKFIQIPIVDFDLTQLKQINFGNIKVFVLETPGHSPGSVCFRIDNFLFTGDTLLKGKIGRTNMPRGDKTVLGNSLKILRLLPSEIEIYPGHGETSTIAAERQVTLNY